MEGKKQKKAGRFRIPIHVLVVAAIVTCIVIIASVQIKSLRQSNQALIEERQELEEEYTEELERQKSLVETSEYMESTEYVEDQARKKLGLVKDDEIIFKESEE